MGVAGAGHLPNKRATRGKLTITGDDAALIPDNQRRFRVSNEPPKSRN